MTKMTSVWSRYQPGQVDYKHRILGRSFGEPGTGKTSFWLGAPGPIVIFSLDQGLEGVIEPYTREGKEIYVAEYDWSPSPDQDFQERAIELRDKYTEDFDHAIHHARTVVIDKETDLWELFRYAEWGSPNGENQRDYAQLNQRYRRLINMPKSLDINFGLIQGMKDEWGAVTKRSGQQGHGPTGARIPRGFEELEGLVHLNIEHVRDGGDFTFNIGKVRGPGARDVQGQTLPALSFVEFATMVFPESEAEEWR